jgi:hypothetical protein
MNSLERRLRRLEEPANVIPSGLPSVPDEERERFFEYLLWHVYDMFYWHTITRSRYDATRLEVDVLGCALGLHALGDSGHDALPGIPGEWLFPSGCVARWSESGGNIKGRIELSDLPPLMEERLHRFEDTTLDPEKRIRWLYDYWISKGRPEEPEGAEERRREVNWLEGGIPGVPGNPGRGEVGS